MYKLAPKVQARVKLSGSCLPSVPAFFLFNTVGLFLSFARSRETHISSPGEIFSDFNRLTIDSVLLGSNLLNAVILMSGLIDVMCP